MRRTYSIGTDKEVPNWVAGLWDTVNRLQNIWNKQNGS